MEISPLSRQGLAYESPPHATASTPAALANRAVVTNDSSTRLSSPPKRGDFPGRLEQRLIFGTVRIDGRTLPCRARGHTSPKYNRWSQRLAVLRNKLNWSVPSFDKYGRAFPCAASLRLHATPSTRTGRCILPALSLQPMQTGTGRIVWMTFSTFSTFLFTEREPQSTLFPEVPGPCCLECLPCHTRPRTCHVSESS